MPVREQFIRRHQGLADGSLPEIRDVDQRLRSMMGSWADLSGQNIGVFDLAQGRLLHATGEDDAIGPVMGNGEVKRFLNRLHPEDAPRICALHLTFLDLMESLSPDDPDRASVLALEHRLKLDDGGYTRVLRQVTPFEWYEQGTKVRATLHLARNVAGLTPTDDRPGYTLNASEAFRETFHSSLQDENNTDWRPSPREKAVLVQLAKGLSSAEIADLFSISIHTVNNHRRNMLRSSGTRGTVQLLQLARQCDMLV